MRYASYNNPDINEVLKWVEEQNGTIITIAMADRDWLAVIDLGNTRGTGMPPLQSELPKHPGGRPKGSKNKVKP